MDTATQPAPYQTPLGGFDSWDAAAAACERADLDPCGCILYSFPAQPAAVKAPNPAAPAPVAVLRVGEVQAAALEIYVLDPIFDEPLDDEDQQPFPGFMIGRELHVFDAMAAWRCLTEAANSCDAGGDMQLCEALCALSRRVGKVAWAAKDLA